MGGDIIKIIRGMELGDSWKSNQIGGDNQRGRGEGEEVCSGSEGGRGGTGEDNGL